MEKSRIIVHLQIAVVNWKNAVENFNHHVTQTLRQMTRPLSGFPCFESLGISSCMCGVSEFNVGQIPSQGRETVSASDSSSEFPRSEANLMVFRGW